MRLSLYILSFLFLHSFHTYSQNIVEQDCSKESIYPYGFHSKKASPQLDNYDMKCYDLTLEVVDTSASFKGIGRLTLMALTNNFYQLVVELDTKLTVDSLFVGPDAASFTHVDDLINITMPSPADSGTLIVTEIHYHGTGNANGLYTGVNTSWNKAVTWTLSEPLSAKNWFPCKQVLGDKADSVKVSVITNVNLKAGSNGLLKRTSSPGGGKVQYDWESFYPTAYYLISIAVSDYQDYSFYSKLGSSGDSVLIRNYVYNHPDYLPLHKNEIDKTDTLIRLFSDLFTIYPFYGEKYGHCLVPGGPYMEHQTMSSMRNFNYRIVAHELAHQWFGDNVTCGTWQDIWINEGFASYSEYLAFEQLGKTEDATAWLKDAQLHAKNDPNGSVYIPVDEVWAPGRLFNYGLTYRKGALILHMLRFEIMNDSVFFAGLQKFQTDLAGSTATGLDFKAAMESVSGLDLTVFFDQWYFGKGYPSYDILWGMRHDTLWIESTQFAPAAEPSLFKMPLEIKVKTSLKDTLIRVFQDQSVERFEIRIPEQALGIEIDPDYWSLIEILSLQQKNEVPLPGNPLYKIYPNPSHRIVYIDFFYGRTDSEIWIMDTTGQILRKYTGTDRIVLIDLQGLSAGVYIVKAFSGGSAMTQKLILQ